MELYKSKSLIKTWVFTVFFVSTIIFVDTVQAQSLSGLLISPPTFELNGNPGDSVENVVKVTNTSDKVLTISTDKRNFAAIGEEGSVGLTEEETSFSLASWITITPVSATLEPGQSQLFNFITQVPANAEPGGHFGSLVFKTGGTVTVGSGASVVQEVASLVLFRVAGKTQEQASIIDFYPAKNFYEYGPIDFEMRLKNEGSVHVKPTGRITITNFFGKKTANIDIDPKNVLPGAIRKNQAQWNTKHLFGKYTATASLVYGNDNKILTATTTFIAIPYKIVIIISVIISIILTLLFRARRRLALAMKILFGK